MSKCAAPLQQIFKAARKGLNCEWLYQVVHVLIQVSWLEVLVAEIHRISYPASTQRSIAVERP
jgi:hypothetical protein